MQRSDWKYLLSELIIFYSPQQIVKFVGTNPVSVYKWLSGETYPRFDKFKKRLIKLATNIDRVNILINNSKIKEKTLTQLAKKPKFKLIGRTFTINTIPIIWSEIKRRETISADKWYIRKIGKEYIEIKYFDNKKNWKNITLPLQLLFDVEFAKVIGMWFGDGVTKKSDKVPHRSYISFSNSEFEILNYLKNFFLDFDQSNCIDLEIIYGKFIDKDRLKSFNDTIKSLNVKMKSREQGRWNSLGASLHIKNAPFSYVFEFVRDNINYLLLNSSNKVKAAFLGGYFTAEGNVSKINQWFTISETKLERRKFILELLCLLGFKDVYDTKEGIVIGHKKNTRVYNFELFRKLILPYIFSKKKFSDAIEMLEGNNLREIDLVYLFYLSLYPDSTSEFFASKFNKHKDHINKIFRRLESSKIRLVQRKKPNNRTEFHKLNLTEDGKILLRNKLDSIKQILAEVKRASNFNRGYKGTFYLTDPAIQEMIKYFKM